MSHCNYIEYSCMHAIINILEKLFLYIGLDILKDIDTAFTRISLLEIDLGLALIGA